jgi:uncharacterized protein (TIGR02466 family)
VPDNKQGAIDFGKSLSMLFGTPFVMHEWSDSEKLNRELKELILAKKADDSIGYGIRSNAGGWQSPGNLIIWKDACVQELKGRIEEMVFGLTERLLRQDGSERSFTLLIDAWANVNRNGDYNVVHTHPNCMWSGAYYIDPGQPDPDVRHSGLLELLDPRESANYIQIQNTVLDARTFIENKPGRMVLFPSWLKHMVHPFVGSGERISIAFNANVVENRQERPGSTVRP